LNPTQEYASIIERLTITVAILKSKCCEGNITAKTIIEPAIKQMSVIKNVIPRIDKLIRTTIGAEADQRLLFINKQYTDISISFLGGFVAGLLVIISARALV